MSRQKRWRQTQNTWRKWTRRNRLTSTQAVSTQETITINQPDWVSSYTIEKPRRTYAYQSTPKPIHIPIYTPRSEFNTYQSEMHPVTVPTKLSTRYPTTHTRRTTNASRTTTQETTTEEPTTTMTETRTLRIEPGTILMMDSDYLKEKYIRPGLATTFHRALLADYFGLSENEMKQMEMTVVAWGFSYQVKDKATSSRGPNRARKYFCDFKFRSATFNAGYVGADINIGITELDG